MDHHINPSTMEIKCGSNSDSNCYQPPPLNKSYMFLNTQKKKKKKEGKQKTECVMKIYSILLESSMWYSLLLNE